MGNIIDSKGLLNIGTLSDIPVKINIITGVGAKNVRTYKEMKPIGITVHNTGNSSASAGAEQHGKHLQNVENEDKTYVSWHFTVDDVCIVQHLPLNETGYHAGDGDGVGNTKTIGIEICENRNYEKAEQNAVALIKALCETFGWVSDVIKPHRYYAPNKKLCPTKILKAESNWGENWALWIKKNFGVDTVAGVKYSVWAESSIEWGIANGLVSGTKENVNWKEPITLERFITILNRYNKM